jgi:hypothetical protein
MAGGNDDESSQAGVMAMILIDSHIREEPSSSAAHNGITGVR